MPDVEFDPPFLKKCFENLGLRIECDQSVKVVLREDSPLAYFGKEVIETLDAPTLLTHLLIGIIEEQNGVGDSAGPETYRFFLKEGKLEHEKGK